MTEAYENHLIITDDAVFSDFAVTSDYFAEVSAIDYRENAGVNINIYNIQENLDSPILFREMKFPIDDPFTHTGDYPGEPISSFIYGDMLIFGFGKNIYMFHILTGNFELLFSIDITDNDYFKIAGVFNNMIYVIFNGDFVEYDMRGNQTSYYEVINTLSDDEIIPYTEILDSQFGLLYCIKSGQYLQLRLLRNNEIIFNILEDGDLDYVNIFDDTMIYKTIQGKIIHINLNINTSHEIYLINYDNTIVIFDEEKHIKASQYSKGIYIWLDIPNRTNHKFYQQYVLPIRRYSNTKSAMASFQGLNSQY